MVIFSETLSFIKTKRQQPLQMPVKSGACEGLAGQASRLCGALNAGHAIPVRSLQNNPET
jgi:hypothetical protein